MDSKTFSSEKQKQKAATTCSLKIKCTSCEEFLDRQFFPKKKFEKKQKKDYKYNDNVNDEMKVQDEHNTDSSSSSPPLSKAQQEERRVCRLCTKKETAARVKQQLLPKDQKNAKKYGRRAESGMKRRPNNFGYCNYVDKLFSMSCFTDIVLLGVFKSAKDVSESMAALQAATKHGTLSQVTTPSSLSPNQQQQALTPPPPPKVLCLCIGDGCTPRTAVLTSFLTKGWECVSIDPELHHDWIGSGDEKNVKGLTGYKGTLEEFIMQPSSQIKVTSNEENKTNGLDEENASSSSTATATTALWDHLVLLCVHSHARFRKEASVDKIRSKYGSIPTSIISLPCCPKFKHVHDIGRPPDIHYEDDCVFSMCRTVEIWNFYGNDGREEDPKKKEEAQYCLPVSNNTIA